MKIGHLLREGRFICVNGNGKRPRKQRGSVLKITHGIECFSKNSPSIMAVQVGRIPGATIQKDADPYPAPVPYILVCKACGTVIEGNHHWKL